MSNIKLVHSGGNSVSLTTPTSNPASNITFKLPQADGSANQVLQTDGNGNLTFVDPPTNTPAFFAYWNANNSQTITDSTDTKATWLTAEDFDTDNAYNTSTQTFTVPSGKAGTYAFNAGVQMYSNGNSLRTVIIRLRKNGSATWAASQYSQVMNADENRMRHHQAHLYATLNLVAGDTIELMCWGRVLNNSLYISNDASGVKSNFLSGYKLIL